jgi:hypothetical protein
VAEGETDINAKMALLCAQMSAPDFAQVWLAFGGKTAFAIAPAQFARSKCQLVRTSWHSQNVAKTLGHEGRTSGVSDDE